MLPAGSWKLDTDDTIKTQLPRFDTQSKQSTQQAFNPPRAVYVRLSDEVLQQLKAAQAGNAPFHLELASPASGSGSGMIKPNASGSSSTLKPTAVTLGDITYPLITPVNNSQSRNKTTELLERVSSSSISKVSSSSQSNSLKVYSSNCTEHYDVGPSTSSRYSGGAAAAMSTSTAAAKEKTAENMGERIRERAAQMAKEKESRKIVLMDDDAFPGVKGKKGKTTAKAQSNLLRASAITAKRSASPAGMPARQSPSLGPTSTTSRPPNRLLANEAAKGLMKKSNLHPPQPTSGGNSETKATSPGSDTSSHMEVAVTPTMSTGAVLAASPQHTPSTAVSSLSAIDSKTANKAAAAPIQGSPARRQFHQMKVDTDDLASASSDSEDEDDAPLAVRITSPVKTHFTAEAVVETQERAAQSQAKATPKTIQRHDRAYSSVNFAAKGKVVSDSASSASEGSASDREAARPQPSAVPSAAMKRLSPESAPSSRASSPGRAAGGPRTMAKTSGGSRLSRPVSKVSPRTSPKAAPVEAAIPALAPSETSSIEASTSSASTRRLPSPLPTVSNSDSMQIDKPAVQESLSVEQDLRPTSRAPSPHPSPRSHPLPAKPPVSPSHIKSHTSLHPPSSKASPPPPAVRQAEQDKSPQQPRPSLPSLGLPANPITGVMPNIPKSPSSLHPPSHSYSHTVSAAPSAHSTPGASPIVSHFPSPSRGSRSPNAGPLRTTTNGKRKDGPKEEANAASMSDKSAITKKKKLNDGTASSLSASTGSEEDGEAEEEEGEYKAEPAEPAIADKASSTTKALQDSALPRNEAPKGVPSKPAISKSGLPSFTKKGRMSELKGRDASTPQPRSQSASRANTPISYGSMEVDAVTSSTSSPYKAKVTGSLRIASDAEFAKRSLEFQDKLYPEYTRLYSKLEDLKTSLSKGERDSQVSKASNISPKQISRMVDEVNERSRELERIKVGLWQYSDEKQRREGSSRNPQGMARVK